MELGPSKLDNVSKPSSFMTSLLRRNPGLVRVPLTNHYKHLGGVALSKTCPHARIASESSYCGLTRETLKALSNSRICIRKTLVKSMGLSVAPLHSGTWFDMVLATYKTWQGMIHRSHNSLQLAHDNAHMTWYQLAQAMAMEFLHLSQIRLFIHIVHVADEYLIGAIICNFELARKASWLAAVQYNCHWWKDRVGVEDLPQQLDELFDLSARR